MFPLSCPTPAGGVLCGCGEGLGRSTLLHSVLWEMLLGYQVDMPRKQLSTESRLRTGAGLRTHGETCPVNS